MAQKRKRKRSYGRRMYRGMRRRTKSKKIPILPILGIGMGIAAPARMLIETGNIEAFAAEVGARYTGYNYQSGQFDLRYALTNGWAPFIAGAVGHVVASKLGVNRYLGRIPMIGKYISL